MAAIDRITEIVTPLAEAQGVQIYDIEHNPGLVRVLIDTDTDAGVGLDAIREVTKAISRAFDDADPVPGTYTLEVSSPGLERPLRTVEHFVRSIGTEVKVKTHPHVGGERRVEGQLTAADDSGIEIMAESGEMIRIALADIARARTVFNWGPTPPKGDKRSKKQKEAKSS